MSGIYIKGKTKPPIPTPRPKDTEHKSYKEDNVDHSSQCPAPNINQEGNRNPVLEELQQPSGREDF